MIISEFSYQSSNAHGHLVAATPLPISHPARDQAVIKGERADFSSWRDLDRGGTTTTIRTMTGIT